MFILEKWTINRNFRRTFSNFILRQQNRIFFTTQQLNYEESILSNDEIFYIIIIERRSFNFIRFIIDE